MKHEHLLPVTLIIAFFFVSCRTSKTIYTEDPAYNTEFRSACREVKIKGIMNESLTNTYQKESSRELIRSIKLRTTAKPEKANYRIEEMRTLVTEKCDEKASGSTSIRITHLLKLKTKETGETFEFTSDTIVVSHRSLTESPKGGITEADLQANLKSLMERNLKKVQNKLRNN